MERRQGTRTWIWRLDANHGSPHLDEAGGVRFSDAGRLSGYHILPVQILDRDGRDVTPKGLSWSLDRNGDADWQLALRLDDQKLPLPYLIDPIVLIAACGLGAGPGGTTSCTAATSTGSSSLGITKPSAAVAGDVLVAQLTVRSTGAITAPGGWNQVGATAQDAAGPIEQALFWHRVDGSEPGTITFSWAGGNADASGGIVTYRGVDPFVGFDQGGSAASSAASGGTNATGNALGLAVTTSAANEMLQAAYGVANGVTVTQSGAQGLVREWTVSSTGGAKVTAGFADGVQAAAGASGNKTATWVTSSLWVANLFALKNEAADGSGTVVASSTAVSASQSALTETLTYTPAAGSMANGSVSFVVPAGWTPPQATTPSAAGYVSATGGSGANSIAVTGTGPWTVTVSSVTLDQGAAQTLLLNYGDTSSGGAGATAPAATGGVIWTTRQRSSSRGALTNLGVQPTITVYAADGAGTVASSLATVSGSQTGLIETLTYTAPAGGLSNGTLTVAVPVGWTAPATSAGPGFTTSSVGAVSVAGQTITVSGVTRTAGQTVVITYGSGATATAPAAPGAQTWLVREASTAGGVLASIAASPTITIYAPDASGSATTPATNVSASQIGNTVVFTYTAATGGMLNGAIRLTIPAGWSAPSVTGASAGYTTSSVGTVAVAAQVVTVSGVTLAAGSTVTITYGSRASAGPGATAAAAIGAQTWLLQQRSTVGGAFTNLGAGSPSITINAANGSGTMVASINNVSASQPGRTMTFTYTAAAGGMVNGAVTVLAPAGWTAPSTVATASGYASASTGTVSAAGQTITVSGVTLAAAGTVTIVYGDTSGGGGGSTASATTGAQLWQARQQSTAGGVLANLAASPSITVYAADGAGAAVPSITVVSANQVGRTVTLTYTAAAGGMLSGSLTVAVPAGWTPPATSAGPGFTTSSVGALSVSGQTITVTGVTRTAGQTVVVTYGSGGTATSAATPGVQAWQIQESSTAAGVPTAIGASPSITVQAADGSGSLTTPTTNVSASQTGNTVVLTYTAAAGGTSGGSVTIVVPAGWSAPSTVASANGYTTSTSGTVATAAQTITISNLTLAGGASATITYGSKAGGGAGATATATTGAQTWQGRERSTASGVLTNLGASPSIVVNAANGSGTLTVAPLNAGNGSAGNTLTFTYTAAAGGMANGAVTVTALAGWSAPSTTASAAGYTTASTGTVSAAGQTITVSGVTLAGGATMTIVYGSTAGGGPGATASATAGANAFSTQQRSTGGGTLASIGASPSVNVYAADGSGTVTTPTANVVNGSTNTIVFTYRAAAAGGTSNGAVAVTVPTGWPAPTAGNTTSSLGARSYAGQTVTVSGLTLAANATFTITYGPAAAPTTGGPQVWSATERSTAGGALTALASSPSINVYAPDGSGTLTAAPALVGFGSNGNTETFTYTAAAGGTSNGSVTVVVPAGWNAPSTTAGNPGNTAASTGVVSVAAQTITVSGVTLSGGATMTIVYGSGAPGATAPAVAGSTAWPARSKASVAGVLTSLGASPNITVAAAPASAVAFPAPALYGVATWNAGCASPGFCGTATDNSGAGLQKVELTIRQGTGNYWDGSGFSSVTPVFVPAAGTGTWSYAFPATSFSVDGAYTVQARAVDNLNGVEAPSSRTFTVDLTPPNAFSLTSPAAAFVGSSALVSATAVDTGGSGIAQLAFRYCAGGSCAFGAGTAIGSPIATTGSASQSWDLSSLTDGALYTAIARATDVAGNTTDSGPTTVTLDTSPPTTTDNAPAGSESSDVTVTLSPSDGSGSGVGSTKYRLDGGAWQTGTSVSIPAPASHANDGAHTIDYYSTDNVGNDEAVKQATVTIDTQPPSGSPIDPGSILRGIVTLSDPSPADVGGGVGSVAFEYSLHGANSWTAIGTRTSAPWSVLFDTTAVPDGQYDLREVISDASVPPNVTTIYLPGPQLIDNNTPAVTLDTPGTASRGTVVLSTTTSPDTVQVTFERSPAGAANWSTIAVDSSAPFSASFDTSLLADGLYDLRALASDGLTAGASNVRTTRIDNTLPTGSIATPSAGATVGGTSVTLAASAADSGTGVATVQFRVDGAPAGTASSTPWTIVWDATSTPSGAHTIDAVVTDAAGNSFTTPGVPITVDATPPSVTLADPGTPLSGTVMLSAASPDADTARVTFQVSPAGAANWTTVANDATPPTPYSGAFDSATVADGVYDLRAIAYDGPGNASAPSTVASRRIDNTPPSVVSASPPDGATIGSVGSIAVTASEALSAVTGARLDGGVTGAATLVGSIATFATGPLADGPHTLAGTLVDDVGKTAPFMTHFTIVSGPPPADWPYVEINAATSATTTLHSSDGGATLAMATGTYSSPADHLVLRIDPKPAASIAGGFATGALVYDVTSYWSLTGAQVHSFSPPLELVLTNTTGDSNVVPTTHENGSWRPIAVVPASAILPSRRADGYFVGPDGIHILTTHLSEFTLLHDHFPPPPPADFVGVVAADGLTLRWVPGDDETGAVAQVQLYVDGAHTTSFDSTQFETKLGPIAAGDPRTFTLTETDRARNVSAYTYGLRALPPLAGLPVDDAIKALNASGFSAGTVTRQTSSDPTGTVLAPADVRVVPLGASVDLTLSSGPAPVGFTTLRLRALAPARFEPARRRTIPTSIDSTRPAMATVTLSDARGRRLASWRKPLRAGPNHPRLLLSTSVRRTLIQRPGVYWLSWTAGSPGDRASDRKRLLVIAPRR